MATNGTSGDALVDTLAFLFAARPEVEAVVLGGSRRGGMSDALSDIDLYVYTRSEIALTDRQAIVEQSGGATQANLGLSFWGPGDEWFSRLTGTEVDIVYFDAAWMEGQIGRVVREHQASMGYTTCFWRTVRHAQLLYDRRSWFQELQR